MSNTLVVDEVEGILSNDTDPDGDALTVLKVNDTDLGSDNTITVNGSNGGQFTIDSDGSYDFDPNGDFDTLGLGDSETTSVTYTVSDGEGGTDTADLVITVGRMGVNIQDDSENEDMIISIDDLTQTIIKGSVPDGCTITGLVISDGNGNEITIDPLDVSITNNSFTITTDVTELVDGELTVKMDLYDPDEKVSGSVTDTIAKDTVTEVTIDPLTVENGEISEITGTGEPGSTINVTTEVENAAGEIEIISLGTATVETDGTWSFTPSNPLDNDVDNIGADAEDPYGNEASTARDIPTLSIADGGEQTVNEAALADGSDPDLDTEEASGTFTISFDPDDLTEISIGGKTITPDDLAGSEVDTEYGTITINGYDSATGEVSYTYELGGNTEDHSIAGTDDVNDEIEIRVTDSNGDIRVDTLDVTVTDDVPDAVDDSYLSVVEGENTISGNVLANDVQGADTATVTGFSYADESGSTQIASAGDTVDTQYGELTVNSDGSWSYTSDSTESHPGGAALEEAFTYTITDTDGDTSSAEQPISITDTSPAIGTPLDTTVSEANLPTGTAPDGPALVQTESLDVQPGADTFLTTFADGITAPDDLTSGGDPVTYTVSNGGHTLTASADGETVFTVEITDPASSSAGYEFTLYGPLDHISEVGGEDGQIDLDFGFKVVDSDGSTVSDSFTVAVLDDAPVDTKTLQLDEDTSITVNTNADAIGGIDGNTEISLSPTHGTAVINADGTLTYTPDGNYSGGDSLSYTTILDDGTEKTTSVDVTVDPLADAPLVSVDSADVSTFEDMVVSLGLNAPSVTDDTDGNAGAEGDNPELLGTITISGIPSGAQLLDGTDGNSVLWDSDGGSVTIVISDGDNVSGITGDLVLTTSQYEALSVAPPADSGDDFTVNVSVTEYEVDSSGNILSGVAGATSQVNVNVDVQAVTDGVDLKIDGSDGPYDLTIDEDSTYDIASLLQANLLDTEGNGPDTDGSETRVLVFENLPEGATVNGQEIGADGSITISLPGNDGTLPTINFTPPSDFSGDLEGITVTLKSTDSDGDSSGAIDTLSDSVTLNLFVNPLAGDVEVQDVSTPEDTGVNFLADLDLTDNDGSEEITGITINDVPDGWVIADENGNVVLTGNGSDDLTIDSDDISSGAYKNYTITPPAHSSEDETLSIDVETTDTQTVNGTTQTSVTMVNLSPEVVVTPVAEAVGGDSDGDSTDDLTLNGNFTYDTAGQEDEWFSLDGTDGFDLDGAWANQDADGSEETFALLSGVPEGSQFRFSTDGGSTFQVLTSDGTNPVEVPVEYLDTLQFRAPEEDDGTFNITVQAKTVDTDPDNGAADTSISGNATLTLDIDPVADDVTLAVSSPARGVEDNPIPLDIRPTSTDDDESFTVKINDIPDGAVIKYDGNELTVTDGSVTIENFDSAADLSITPPSDSNEDFTLEVRSRSIEGGDESDWTDPLSTVVKVAGVADEPVIETETLSVTEADVDAADGEISLSSVITSAAVTDTDGSETLTLTLRGLADGFDIEGATFTGGTGEDRVWILTPEQLATATLTSPENFSGTIDFTARPVTTENDGDSWTGSSHDLSVEVTPSPESVIETSTTVDEDTLGQVDFSIVHQNGDTDETLSSVSINQADVDGKEFTLYLGNGTETTIAEAAADGNITEVVLDDGYYKLTGDAIDNIYVQGGADRHGSYDLDIKYEITDPSSDETLDPVTDQFEGTHNIAVEAVTDPVEVVLGDITSTGNATVSGADVTATGNTVISV